MQQIPQDVTALLAEVNHGDHQPISKLVPLVYNELRQLADRYMRREHGAGKQMMSLENALVFSPELRFFDELTVEETAHLVGISPKTVKREWSLAKAWLHGELKASHGKAT